MRLRTALLVLAVSCWPLAVAAALENRYEGARTNALSLNGAWEFALGDGSERAEDSRTVDTLQWAPVALPGSLLKYNDPRSAQVRFAWVRRSFTLTPAQARSLAILRWNQITFGATAYVNGREVGENAPTGPYQALLPERLLRPGANRIVLRIAGGAGAPRARSGSLLIPAGFGDTRQPPMVQGDIWLDFAHSVYMKWVLALPDLESRRVRIRVTLCGPRPVPGLRLSAQVRRWPDGLLAGEGSAPAALLPATAATGERHTFVDVAMSDCRPWTPDDPKLYSAVVRVQHGKSTLDVATIRFGMRSFGVVDGRYRLNGKTFRLRGSELCFEWQWAADRIHGNEQAYLVTEAREMNMNAFRTHTMPPPPLWADVCDEGGTLLLVEFPCLYNYQDYRFTKEEYEVWHKHVLSDAAGWMARLWNHPSVVMWVLSNESHLDNAWEYGPYHNYVRRLDPSRPTMRTGTNGTPDTYDVHSCGNIEDTLEGNLIASIHGWFGDAKGRPLTNSEYMNYFGRPVTQWTGNDDRDADNLAVAQLGMEHTEAMRRARLDGLLPYMYAGWTKTRTGRTWKAGFATPASAAWHSALSPVLASLDLFDPNYVTGQEVTTDLVLINDSWHNARIHVDVLLTAENPEFVPEASCLDRPLARWSYDFSIEADSIRRAAVRWRIPEQEGAYWLTARTTGMGGRPVLSQRYVRAVHAPETPSLPQGRRFVVLGGNAEVDAWFDAHRLPRLADIGAADPERDVVVIWNAEELPADPAELTRRLRDFGRAGGKIAVLGTRVWRMTSLCEVTVKDMHSSRAYVFAGVRHALTDSVRPGWLERWNGLPGGVVVGRLEGPAMASATKLLWARDPGAVVAADVPLVGGEGRIVFTGLDVQHRLREGGLSYDPVAERVLLQVLASL